MSILQPVTRTGCGCDGRDLAKRLVTIDAALGPIADRLNAVEGTEQIRLSQALGRVLANPVKSLCMSLPFDNAAMDGYAFASAALRGDGPWILDVVVRVQAGQSATLPLLARQAARIFTGAKVPEGADAVVMQEEVRRTGNTIRIDARPTPGLNIRRAGSEMAAGVTVLEKGHRLDPRAIAACAAAGAGSVTVRRRLRVALLVTGDEIRAAGSVRAEAQIWDVNTPMMTSILTQPRIYIVAVEQGIDSLDGLFLQIAELAANADLVITTGDARQVARRHVVTGTAISRKARRCELRPATCTGFDSQGRKVVTFASATHSGHVCALPEADGLIFLPADCDFLPEGALVEFQPLCRT